MKAARVREIGKIVIEDVPIPEINEKEILIAVHRAGICGTDVGGRGRPRLGEASRHPGP